MDKSPDAFRTISEVADMLDTPAHVLRFWESRFAQVRPVKRAGGRRYYRPTDVALLAGIRALLHDQGVTIRGVQKILRERGVRQVAQIGTAVLLGAPVPHLAVPDEDRVDEGAEDAAAPAPPAPAPPAPTVRRPPLEGGAVIHDLFARVAPTPPAGVAPRAAPTQAVTPTEAADADTHAKAVADPKTPPPAKEPLETGVAEPGLPAAQPLEAVSPRSERSDADLTDAGPADKGPAAAEPAAPETADTASTEDASPVPADAAPPDATPPDTASAAAAPAAAAARPPEPPPAPSPPAPSPPAPSPTEVARAPLAVRLRALPPGALADRAEAVGALAARLAALRARIAGG
jgi:DNA-binding transcriptional MerR regulator